jgi:predicted metal-dependent hydrolase
MASQPGVPPVEVRRSTRRRRTVAAYEDGETVVVLIPARFTAAEEREWVEKMVGRLQRRGRGSRSLRGDAELERRAQHLSQLYLDSAFSATSVRWVTNQRGRWGSCTPSTRAIRLSTRLQTMPGWVIDYVLVHELVHVKIPHHGPAFWELVRRYPHADRARGYLEGIVAAGSRPRTEASEEWQTSPCYDAALTAPPSLEDPCPVERTPPYRRGLS